MRVSDLNIHAHTHKSLPRTYKLLMKLFKNHEYEHTKRREKERL